MKVLIVEDHALMRQLIRSVINDLAEAVIECADGAEAFAACAAQPLTAEDWVLMDLEMPGVDGLEATRRIHVDFPDARILIVTQHGDTHLRAAACAAGACGYVLKENLLELQQWLQKTGERGSGFPKNHIQALCSVPSVFGCAAFNHNER